jgi:hypothetical protein
MSAASQTITTASIQTIRCQEATMNKSPSIEAILYFLKGPALIVLMLAGFILEFLIEWPFRFVTITAGNRRPARSTDSRFDFMRSIDYK